MAGFCQDLQKLLVSFLPWPVVPGATQGHCLAIWPGLWALTWAGSTHSGPLCFHGCSEMPPGFSTALGGFGGGVISASQPQ